MKNCEDESDEVECRILTYDRSLYRKAYKPKPLDNESKLNINVSITVHKVDAIKELESSYRIQFTTRQDSFLEGIKNYVTR